MKPNNQVQFIAAVLDVVKNYDLDGALVFGDSGTRSYIPDLCQVSISIGSVFLRRVFSFGSPLMSYDQEYPNQPGAGQPYSPDDAANLLSFFQSLRSKLGKAAIISAAVTDQPFTGPDGRPLKDVSAYAKVMTYVNLMYTSRLISSA